MTLRTNLDMDVLRTFVTGFELGSFARAAERLGRSQSAVSAQLRKLEEQVGRALVEKSGRGLALTDAGEHLLGYAKRLLELNDEAVESIRGADVAGWARLGLPQDFAESWLPAVLTRFSRANPKVLVEVQVDRSTPLIEKTAAGELDIALVWGESASATHAETVAQVQMEWIGRPGQHSRPLPLAVLAPPCAFRTAALAALDHAKIPWRLVFTSPSVSGLWAATDAGLGITARTLIGMPEAVGVLDPAVAGLPRLPTIPLVLHRSEADASPAVGRLADILLETIREDVGVTGRL